MEEKKTAEENRQAYIASVIGHTAKNMAVPFDHAYVTSFIADDGGADRPIAAVIEIMAMNWHIHQAKAKEVEYEFSPWQYERAIEVLRAFLDRAERDRLPEIKELDNEVQAHVRKYADVPTEKLTEWYLNARTTYNECGGHKKADRNRNSMERYWNALAERGDVSMDEIKSRKGKFNGEGSS